MEQKSNPIHGAGKTAKQIKKIAVTFNVCFLNQFTARIIQEEKKANFSIIFQENSIFLERYFLQEMGVVPP